MNMPVDVFVYVFSILLDILLSMAKSNYFCTNLIQLKVELVGHKGILHLTFLRKCYTFPQFLFYLPTSSVKVSNFSKLANICYFLCVCVSLSFNSHPSVCEVVSHHGFDLYFPHD